MSLIERIRAKCIDDAGCWLWQGTTSASGMPRMCYEGKPDQIVRRLIERHRTGQPIPPGVVVSPTCGNPMCVNPDHLKARTIAEARAAAAERGAYLNRARMRKSALTKRARSRITDETIAAIKAAKNSPEAARLTGVSVSYAWSIRVGRARQDYSNPFIGLA